MSDSFFRSLENARCEALGVEVIVECLWCHSIKVTAARNSQGKLYCRCQNCGMRFWDDRH